MRRLVCSVMLLVAAAAARPAAAGPCDPTCTVNTASGDVTYPCDRVCGSGVACVQASALDVCPYTCHDGTLGPSNGVVCQSDGDCTVGPYYNCAPGGGDTVTAICGTSGDDIIIASFANAVVCGNNGNDGIYNYTGGPLFANGGAGNDIITGSGGNDRLMGGTGSDTIFGSGGADVIFVNGTGGTDGPNLVSGDAGDDVILGAESDDVLAGGANNDTIAGQGGRDVLLGNDGTDSLISALWMTPANDVLGSILCGGADNDTIVGSGPSHQCMNGGAGTDSCTYANNPDDDTDPHDVGTARDCESTSQTSTYGDLLDRPVGCGCE